MSKREQIIKKNIFTHHTHTHTHTHIYIYIYIYILRFAREPAQQPSYCASACGKTTPAARGSPLRIVLNAVVYLCVCDARGSATMRARIVRQRNDIGPHCHRRSTVKVSDLLRMGYID